METRPHDLPDSLVAKAVATGWGLTNPTVAYLPVGFGSHHWSVVDGSGRRWFVSIDAAPQGSDGHTRLLAALATAATARHLGMDFVVAPVRSTSGDLTWPAHPGYLLALYPHVVGLTGSFHDDYDPATAREVVERLAALHGATPELLHRGARPEPAATDLPARADLEAALADAAGPAPAGDAAWGGPYGERLRTVLRRHAATIGEALRLHDTSAEPRHEGPEPGGLVVTHGEPHPGNVIRTGAGPVLVDWDTVRMSAPERDLWHVTSRLGPDDARDAVALYAERTGRPVDPGLLEHHRLAWALADVAAFTVELRQATTETADSATAWRALAGTLEELAARHPQPAARHTSPAEPRFLGQEVTTRTSPAGP